MTSDLDVGNLESLRVTVWENIAIDSVVRKVYQMSNVTLDLPEDQETIWIIKSFWRRLLLI